MTLERCRRTHIGTVIKECSVGLFAASGFQFRLKPAPAIHAMACEDRPQVGGQRNCEQEWTISPGSSVTPIA